MICKDMQRSSIVEDKGFSKSVSTLDLRYQLPSRRTITRNMDDSCKTQECASKGKERTGIS